MLGDKIGVLEQPEELVIRVARKEKMLLIKVLSPPNTP